VSPVDWLPLVAELCALDPPIWVMGGIAEELLLDGSITQEHGDIDVLVARGALPASLRAFDAIAFPSFEVYFEVLAGQPLVLGSERDGKRVEIGVFDELEPALPSFVLPTEDRPTRFILPEDTLRYPVTEIQGASVRTVSPLALYHLRGAFILTGAFGPPRHKDVVAQARLRDELLAHASVDELRMRSVPV